MLIAPAPGCMAHGAIVSILSIMFVFMTGNTIAGQAAIRSTSMAFCAIQAGMLSNQRETGHAMIEACATPTAGFVTGAAVRAELTVMVIIRSVTCITVRGCSFVAVGVACCAWNSTVSSVKREASIVMIEVHVGPLRGFMAGTAIGAELTVVLILAGMASVTIRGRSLISICMTGLAVDT